jgi:hypothetical protein
MGVEQGEAAHRLDFDVAGRIVKLTNGIRKPDGQVETDSIREFAWDRNGGAIQTDVA